MTTINHPGTTGDEPDYEAFVHELEEWDRTHCGAHFTTPGSDPWIFTCDRLKHTTGHHSMTNPMGPDTPTFTWR